MNAEFLEQKIVVTTETVEGETVTTINPAKVRKGMDALAFLGVTVIAGSGAFIVTSVSEFEGLVGFGAGTSNFTYNPATGVLTVAPAIITDDPTSGGLTPPVVSDGT